MNTEISDKYLAFEMAKYVFEKEKKLSYEQNAKKEDETLEYFFNLYDKCLTKIKQS